jgi:sulfide:quinone oxidoreductase
MFAVKEYARALERVAARKGIETRFQHQLVEIRPERREAVFADAARGEQVAIEYDMIHVTPPQGPPACVKGSALADAGGWVDVDKHSLRHRRFPNVFSLGDASSLPTSKTGAAVRKQAPVLVANLAAVLQGREPSASYDGYTSCPLVTGYGKLILAEFDYEPKPTPTLPWLDSTKERWSYYQLKRYGLPLLYWQGMLKGRA